MADPIQEAFDNYERPPRDIVPRVARGIDDLRALADCDGQVLVTHYEISPDGVQRHCELASITQPITNEENQTP